MKKSSLHVALSVAFSALALSGCYIVPVGPEAMVKLNALLDQAQTTNPGPQGAPNPAQGATRPAKPPAVELKAAAAAPAIAVPAGPTTLYARLYPANEIATENGMVSGTVTSMMNGKGRFQVTYRGETLTGEATRVSGEDRKGVASAWGPNGSFMSCEYQMSSLVRGAGTCHFSDGARYQVHVGN
jgi:hypothetical protein